MSQPDPAPRSLSPDDALPPVEPPTAGFIVQLFVVPAVIVLIIVMLWLMFSWLAHMGDDPDKFIDALQRNNPGRWQAASSLAFALRESGNDELKQNTQQAQKLAELLSNEIDRTAGDSGEGPSENDTKLRAFLARALGEFYLPEIVLPALLKAATTQHHEQDRMVRRAALEAIAVLASNTGPERVRAAADVEQVLLDLSEDESSSIRSVAAYAMGVVDGPAALDRLAALLHDAHPTVRYNAATALARHGRPEAIDQLIEMLDPEFVPADDGTSTPESRQAHEWHVRRTALSAIGVLIENTEQVPVERLRPPLEQLRDQPGLDKETRVLVESLLHELGQRPAAAGA